MDNDNTMTFKVDELENYMITEILSHVNNSLSEKGYNGIDKSATIASFYDSLRYDDENVLIENIKFIVEKENIKAIVLGLPKNMNGSLGARAKETIAFKDKLASEISIDVFLEDERLTTKLATNVLVNADLSRAKRKKVIDGVSAVIILQAYLDRKE